MFVTLVKKELRAILLSPRFALTFAACSLLILLSVYTGVREYRAERDSYEAAVKLADLQAEGASGWRNFSYRVLREPDPMRAFVSGLSSDLGRWSNIMQDESVKLRHSAYSDDPLFALFRMVDFSFVVGVVLSLFALLFTYDAVSGERESGTLRLVFANGVPRATYLTAKGVGAWLGLVVPLAIPVLLALALLPWLGLPLSTGVWQRVAMLMFASLLYFTFFIVLGLLISALTRHSATSFLVALVVWIVFVLIVPRGGMMAAGQLVSVPRVAEIEGKRDAFAQDQWRRHYEAMEERFREGRAGDSSHPHGEDSDQAMWERMQREDSLRRLVEARIQEFESQLLADLQRRREVQERLALTLARCSPVSAYQLAAMELAGTDLELKSRTEDAMSRYREDWLKHVEAKQAETGDMGGFVSIEINSETGLKIGGSRGEEHIDLSDMPRYAPVRMSLAHVLPGVATDLTLLAVAGLVAFLGAWVAFWRYDVR
jgi:ABC-type transport system involved in multi-copper enzyme maturation permease subunit